MIKIKSTKFVSHNRPQEVMSAFEILQRTATKNSGVVQSEIVQFLEGHTIGYPVKRQSRLKKAFEVVQPSAMYVSLSWSTEQICEYPMSYQDQKEIWP